MSMHLEGPWLSTTGKKKGRQKFRNAEQAKQARELAASWQAITEKYKPVPSKSSRPLTRPVPKLVPPPGRTTNSHIPSLNNGVDTMAATKRPDKVYTGTKIIGIGTMHKSNAVPIFSDQEAQDISKMRR